MGQLVGFRAWLRTQQRRDDRVGEFARLVTLDTSVRRRAGTGKYFPAHPIAWSEVASFLQFGMGRPFDHDGAHEAWNEYRALA